mmetsp:Transcript_2613/g.9991  ORF Transcript_2613/g.9991 Transcript_2613/m.9991 type:complete len:122 (+) Transcript_2613:131-496(+)
MRISKIAILLQMVLNIHRVPKKRIIQPMPSIVEGRFVGGIIIQWIQWRTESTNARATGIRPQSAPAPQLAPVPAPQQHRRIPTTQRIISKKVLPHPILSQFQHVRQHQCHNHVPISTCHCL